MKIVKKETVQKIGFEGQCLKVLLTIFNAIFLAFGTIIAGVAGWARFNYDSVIPDIVKSYKVPILLNGLNILFAVGMILIAASILGIWGAIAENQSVLYVYITLILVVFCLQLSGIIITFVEFNKLQHRVKISLGSSKPVPKSTRKGMAHIQKIYHCCGLNGPGDYKNNPIPPSCYAPLKKPVAAPVAPKHYRNTTMEGTTTIPLGPLYTRGCLISTRHHVMAAGGIAIAILVLEAFVVLFTCCFLSTIEDEYTPV